MDKRVLEIIIENFTNERYFIAADSIDWRIAVAYTRLYIYLWKADCSTESENGMVL